MQEGLSFFATHLGIGIAEDKSNCGEEVTLARAVATDDDIVFWRKGLDDGLVLVAITGACQIQRDQPMRKKSTFYLLKPWMMICLMCMFSSVSQSASRRCYAAQRKGMSSYE